MPSSLIVKEEKRVDRPHVGIAEDYFSTGHLKRDLKKHAIRGGAVTSIGQILSKLVQVVSTMILARLLRPEDFGLIAMATVLTGFIALFTDLGLSFATVQRKEINHGQVSTLFWISVGLGFTAMFVVMGFAPVLAWFYKDPKILDLTIAMSLGFMFGGFSCQHGALLRRQMHFGVLALINILSTVFAAFVGIISAVSGAGVWSFVYMSLSGSIFGMAALWIACKWRPKMPSRQSGIKSILAFGGNLTCVNILHYFARNTDNMLIGRFLGAGQLGIYNKAYQLLLLPLRQITYPVSSVAVPTLSRLQDDPEQYSHYYYRAVNAIAFVTSPLVITMAALSDEIIYILLGSQWIGAARIFKVLAFAALVQPLTGTIGWVFISLGRTKRMFKWELISLPFILLSFVIGLHWGVIGIAVCYTVCSFVVLAVPSMCFAFKYSPLKLTGFFRAIWRPMVFSLILFSVIELICFALAGYGTLWVLPASFIGGLMTFLAALLLWGGFRREWYQLLDTLKMLRHK